MNLGVCARENEIWGKINYVNGLNQRAKLDEEQEVAFHMPNAQSSNSQYPSAHYANTLPSSVPSAVQRERSTIFRESSPRREERVVTKSALKLHLSTTTTMRESA